jgi:hypothetical protein
VSARPPHRIHIVGVSPRTGTTLLAECMVACLKIDGYEPHEASISRLRVGPNVYLTKLPRDLMAVEPRLMLDRTFHVICLMRDPRDVIVSRHGQAPDRYWTPLRIWKQRVGMVRRLANHGRFLLVRYEDLVSDPDGTDRRIRERLRFLESTHPFSAFAAVARPTPLALEALGPVRAFSADRVGGWRHHLPRVAGQLARYGSITDELIEFGYEPDARWLSMLDGVVPDMSASQIEGGLVRRLRYGFERSVVPWFSAFTVSAGRAVGLRVV